MVRINHSNHTTSSNSQWHHIYGARRLQTPITRAPVWSFPCCLPHYDSKLFFFQKYFEPIFLGGAAKRGLSLFQGELNQPYSPIKGHIPYWSYTRLDDKYKFIIVYDLVSVCRHFIYCLLFLTGGSEDLESLLKKMRWMLCLSLPGAGPDMLDLTALSISISWRQPLFLSSPTDNRP